MAAPRYAVYFAPDPDHPLWQAGSTWLGRDARRGQPLTPPRSADVAKPWRYGFHATLKAPMALAPDAAEADWLGDVAALAARQRPFAMPSLHVTMLKDFLVLRPTAWVSAGDPLRRLADACVTELDGLRARLTPNDPRRQRPGTASARQAEHVERFGYAYVFDDWRFHFTLSGRLAGGSVERIAALARCSEQSFATALSAPMHCDALCVFVEPAPMAAFELTHRFAFGGGGESGSV